MAEEVKLFGMWLSPYSHRIQLALKLKGVEYEYVEEDLSNKSPSLLKYNPVHKKIPVLLHNGKPITESLVILEYIDDTWKHNPILPKDPYDRAMARFWAKSIDEQILPKAWEISKVKGEEREQVLDELQQQLKLLENELNGKEFLGNDSFGYLDIVAFAMSHWFQLVEKAVGVGLITEDKFPMLFNWTKKIFDIEVVNQSLPSRAKHFDFVEAHASYSTSN